LQRNWAGELLMTAQPPSFATQQIKELSEEVSRIAAALARLSLTFAPGSATVNRPPEEAPEISVKTLAWLIKARSQRARYLSTEFCDPAWDILLDLLRAELSGERVSVSSVCLAAVAPQTTALRYLKKMTAEGTIIRCADPFDGRRVFVELAPETSRALRLYIAEVVQSTLSSA
jgi:hypothetical protein